MLLITYVQWCQALPVPWERWSCRNMVLFYVVACAAAPGSHELAGSLNKVGKQTKKGLLS